MAGGYTLRLSHTVAGLRLPPSVSLTCFQVPEVLAADLVVPGLSVAVTPTPNVQAGVDCYGTVAGSGSGNIVLQRVHQDGLPGHGIWEGRQAEVSSGVGRETHNPRQPFGLLLSGMGN